jgi:multiple RNA-binding domain-containing protein 1
LPKEGVEEVKEDAMLIDDKRLYVMNLSYTVTEDELRELFSKYGPIVDIEIPFRKGGKGTKLGLAFVRYEETESAISAYAELDQKYWQGRKLHIKPAEKKPPKVEREFVPREPREFNEGAGQQSSYKQQKDLILKTNFDDETNWNYLYIN